MAVLAAILSAGACASAGGRGASGARNVITAEELATVSGNITVYDAIQRLRPHWLQPFRSIGIGGRALAQAWLDDRRLGELEEFRKYQVSEVKEIRYLSGTDTATRYGAEAGVIMAYSRR